MSGALPGLILSAGTGMVFIYGGYRVVHGDMTVGTFVAFIVFVLGCNACLIGGILTIPAGAMLLAALVARWQSCLDAPTNDAQAYR